MLEREAVLLRTLLRDLGVVFQRTGLPGPCNIPLPKPFQEALCFPDELPPLPAERLTRLIPITGSLCSEQSMHHHSGISFRYPLNPLSVNFAELMPKNEETIKGYLRDDYRQIWQQFIEEIQQLQEQTHFDAYFFTLYFLLKKYFSRVPSAETPDISLFDYARTTTAIEICRYDYQQEHASPEQKGAATHDEKKELLLIEGDIPESQQFLFTMACPQHEGARLVKRLRGRSLYVLLLAETLVEYLLKQLDLTIVQQLWCTGGRFLILAPNTPSVTYHLKSCYHDINDFLFRKFRGDLALVMGSLAVSEQMLYTRMNTVRMELRNILEREETRKLCSVLQTQDSLQFEAHPSEEGGDAYDFYTEQLYKEQEQLGQRMTRLNQGDGRLVKKVKTATESWHQTPLVAFEIGKSYHIAWDINPTDYRQADTVYLINNIDDKFWGGGETKYGFKFMATHVDVYNQAEAKAVNEAIARQGERNSHDWVNPEDMKGFPELAATSVGGFLGVLWMNVDHPGAIFGTSVASSTHGLARMAALKGDIEFFLTGYVNHLCRTEFKKNTSITYAGGDDLCIVGVWDEVLNLACRIREDFVTFTCRNPDVRLSGGLMVCRGIYPISRAAEQAKYFLDDLSKENILGERDLKGNNTSGDTFAIFHHRLPWRDFLSLRKVGDQLVEAIAKQAISRIVLNKLLDLHQTWETSRQLNTARMYYLTVRTIQDKLCRDLLLGQHRYLENTSYIPILVKYVALKTRSDKEGGNNE